MSIDWVLDASVLAKCLFQEGDSDHARNVVSTNRLIAPDFIFVELASIAAKKVRRGEERTAYAVEALGQAKTLLAAVASSAILASQAFVLAAEHGVSAYDGIYLALAMERNLAVLTADVRLVNRAKQVGLGQFVRALLDAG